jgi:hypothetical protein
MLPPILELQLGEAQFPNCKNPPLLVSILITLFHVIYLQMEVRVSYYAPSLGG